MTPPINDRYVRRRFVDDNGNEVVEVIVPGKPPDTYRAPVATHILTAVTLSNVPAYDWSFGCSATSAAMIAGYYDTHGYPNMYTGPTNGGVMPLDNSSWGTVTINGEVRSQCPLSATRNGLDGRATRGHVDDYWVSYNSSASDPYITNGWTQHTYGECTGDFMKTNQSAFGNLDGWTDFFFYSNGVPYSGTDPQDGCCGLRLFFESRGYTMTTYFTQTIYGYNGNTQGFTRGDFQEEIDAGRPVMIQVEGHSMIGYGYDNTSSTIYIHDTWDYSNHQMTWGGSYSGLQQWGVGVYRLSPNSSNNTFAIQNLGNATLNVTSITDNKTWLTTSPAVPPQLKIAAAGSQDITVSVDWSQVPDPQDVGTITIASNDPDEPSVTVQVTAIKMPQTVSVTSPNGGENWVVGSVHNITWTSSGIANVKIDYTTDNGTSWPPVTASTGASSGSYPWTVPNTPSTQCKIRISDVTDGSPIDESNAVFTISIGEAVQVTSPNGGEEWVTGSTHNITWTSSFVDNVKIELSANNGSDWIAVVSNTAAAPGSYSWHIPNPPANQCRIRIIDLANPIVADTSDNPFTITGLIAYYPFNGNANDESGNGRNGVVTGATLTSDRFGSANSAYYFDGVGNKINCGDFHPTVTSFSVSARFHL